MIVIGCVSKSKSAFLDGTCDYMAHHVSRLLSNIIQGLIEQHTWVARGDKICQAPSEVFPNEYRTISDSNC